MNNNINLTDLDLMAMFRVAQEIAHADGDITPIEGEIFIKYAAPLGMSQGRMDRFINSATRMDLEDAYETLKELEPELKQYASNFFAEVALADGDVSDEENDIYANVMETCDLPFTTIGQDNNTDTATESKYSKRELCAIQKAFINVWDASNAGKAVKSDFWERYDVFGSSASTAAIDEAEAESVLYAMSDEKKVEVSKLLLDVIVAKDPGDTVFCDVANIEEYYDLVVRTGLPDLLTDHVLDYKNEEDDYGETPKGLSFTLQDLYAVWSIVNPNFSYCALSYPIDGFFNDFCVDGDFFSKLQEDNYLKNLGFYDSEERVSRLGSREREHISTIMAETISVNLDDEDIGVLLGQYKSLVDDYGLPDSLGDFLDGHGISEYRPDKQAIIRKVEIEPDLFVDGLSQTKIKVSLEVDGCKDGELRLIASVYYADDDSPVPDPDFMHYGNYSWNYDGVGDVLSVYQNLFPSYDFSGFTDLEMLLPNDLLPADRDYYIKVYVFDVDEQVFISYPFHTQQYSFKATKNEWNPDEALLEPTYMVVQFDKGKHYFYDVVPNCSYTPCTVDFVTIPLGEELQDVVKAKRLSYIPPDSNPKLKAISASLDLRLPHRDDVQLAILYDSDGSSGPNPLQTLAGNVARETMVVCLMTPDGYHCGFVQRRKLREVLVALEKHIDSDSGVTGSLASNVWFSGEANRLVKRKFWDEINTSFYHLKYQVKVSRKAKVVGDKNVKIDKTTFYRNVMINGVSHTRFTLNIVVYGCKGVKCTCEITLRGGKYQSAIRCDEAKYCGWFENICLHKEFTPSYDATRYEELNLDIPDRIINKCKDTIDLIRVEFFTFDGYNPIEVVGNKDFRIKL